MNVYRIHIRPYGNNANPKDSFDYCKRHLVLGMGWAVDPKKSTLTWDEYIREAEALHGYSNVAIIRYMNENVQKNDLVWTRDEVGIYHLAKVTKPWKYLSNNESRAADIVNFFTCEKILRVEIDDVPGKVVACFRPSRTIQAIRDDTVAAYSKLLWNLHSSSQPYSLEELKTADIFTFLDDKSTEDAVAIFLQAKGWLLVPGSRKVDTMSYEYILIHRETKERAVVQVKTGSTLLDRDKWSAFASRSNARAILFQPYCKYEGSEHRNVECIRPDELCDFMDQHTDMLPKSIAHWCDFVRKQPRQPSAR